MDSVFSHTHGVWENLTTNYKKYMYGDGQSSNGRTRSYSSSLPKKVTARPISASIDTCPQCEQPFKSSKDARVLECSHAFCLQCLQNLEYSQIIKCPICNASTILEDDGVEGLVPVQLRAPSVDDFGSPPKEPLSSQKRLSRSFETIDLGGDLPQSDPQEVPDSSRQLGDRRRSVSKSPPELAEEGEFVLLEKEPLDELPHSYVPFTMDKDVSRTLMEQWIDSIWFPPSDLQEAKVLGESKALYVPFYNFTVHTTTAWDCQIGMYKEEGKLDFELVRDTFSNSYSQILTCASYSVPESLVNTLLKANGFSSNSDDKVPSDAIEYHSKLENELSIDFGPEAAYEIVARKYVEKNEREAAKSFIKRNHRPDKRGELNVNVKIEQLEHVIIMLPVYLSGFSYCGTTYEVMISGNKGMVVGNRPYGTGILGKMMTNGWEKVRSVYNENIS